MKGFGVALRNEFFVGLHTLGSKLVILLPTGLVLLQFLFNKLTAASNEARDNLFGADPFALALDNHAWGFFVDGLSTGLTLLGLLLVAQAAYSFAYDRETGALRHLLIRRCSRSAVILAKLVYIHLLAVLSVLLLMAVSYLASAQLWEFGPVVEDGFELIGEAEIRREVSLGLRMALIPIPAAIAFAVLVSVSANSATQAITVALGLTLSMDIFKGMMGSYADYLYARFQPSLIDESYLQDVSRLVRGYSDVLVDERVLQLNAWTPLPFFIVFVIFALWLIQRRRL